MFDISYVHHFSYFFAKCVTSSHFCWSNGYIISNTSRKSDVAVLLSPYSSPLGKWFSRYENQPFCYFFAKSVIFSHFCSSNGHTLYQTLIGNWILWFYWALIEVHQTSGSRDMKISHFSYFFAKCVTFSHFYWSNGYTLYETLVGNQVLRLYWALI